MLSHNLFESIVEQVIVLKESKPTSSALVLNGLNNTRPSSSSLRNTYDIMGGVGIWKGVRISCWIYFEYFIFQHDMKTFSDFPTRVAFREPSISALCAFKYPPRPVPFWKSAIFFSTKSNWIKYWQIGDTAVFVIKVLLTTKKVIVNALSMVTAINWRSRTVDYQWNIFHGNHKFFCLWQTILADIFWGILSIFGRFININFGTVHVFN